MCSMVGCLDWLDVSVAAFSGVCLSTTVDNRLCYGSKFHTGALNQLICY